MAQPQQPLPIALPPPPNDPNVHLPTAPAYPATRNSVEEAQVYRRDVKISIAEAAVGVKCTPQDDYNSLIYLHEVISQAAAAAAPIANAPPWFHPALQQLRQDIQNDFRDEMRTALAPVRADAKRLINRHRGNGDVVSFDIVPFVDGTDPTQAPHGLPPLHSFASIENLQGPQIVSYLTRYGVPPPVGAHPHDTNRLRKNALRKAVAGAS